MNYNPNNRPINQSRRPKLDMDDEWNAKFLNKIRVGHISTRDGNQPFINPTSFWYNKEDHEIYFHSNAVGRMRFNAENNPETRDRAPASFSRSNEMICLIN